MAWILLIIAGLFEIAWAVGLKYTDGFTRPVPTALTVAAIIVSMVLLGLAARDLPIGTAYAVWTGIGAAGVFAMGVWLFDEPATAGRIACVTLIVTGIVGLRLLAPEAQPPT